MTHLAISIFAMMLVLFIFMGIRAIIKMETVGGGIAGLFVSIVGFIGSLAGIVVMTIYSYSG